MDNEKKIPLSLPVRIAFDAGEKVSDLITKFTVSILYLGKNRNRSFFSQEVVEDMCSRIGGIPVIGKWDAEKQDFCDHGSLMVKTEEDGTVTFGKESLPPFGFIPESPKLWWETRTDDDGIEREYLCTESYLWTGRYSELDTLKDGLNHQSMELNPYTMEGTWEEIDGSEVFKFSKADFFGLCILGKDVEPCFEGASFKTNYNYEPVFMEKLNEMKKELDFALKIETQSIVTKEQEIILHDDGKEETISIVTEITNETFEPFEEKEEEEVKEDIVFDNNEVEEVFEEVLQADEETMLEENTEESVTEEVVEDFVLEEDPNTVSFVEVDSETFKEMQDPEEESAAPEENFELTLLKENKTLQEEIESLRNELATLNANYSTLEEQFNNVKSELEQYKEQEILAEKENLLDTFKEDLPEEVYNSLHSSLKEMSNEDIELQALKAAYTYSKTITSFARKEQKEETINADFTMNVKPVTLGDEESSYPIGTWQYEAVKREKAKRK